MAVQSMPTLQLPSLNRYVENKKVIVLYPNSIYRVQLTRFFRRELEGKVFYHKLSRADVSLREWLIESVQDYALQDFDFNAEHILEVIHSTPDVTAWAKAVSQSLSSLTSPRNIFILEDFDLTPATDELAYYLKTLFETLPDHCLLVISSRILAYHPWLEIVTSNRGIVFGSGINRSSLVSSPSEGKTPQLEVNAFGTGSAFVNGRELTHWDGSLPRTLFFFLIDNPLVTRDQIFKVFWPSLGVKEATNVFHVTKRKIGERLTELVNDGNEYELTSYAAGFYSPSKNIIRKYDVKDFEDTVLEAQGTNDDRLRYDLCVRAISLYKDDFLSTMTAPWANERREKLRLQYVEALAGAGNIASHRGEFGQALVLFEKALEIADRREDVYRALMDVYAKLGRSQDAVLLYRKLEAKLRGELDLQPSRETRNLLEQIMTDY
jgi:two-component SAPR family response regulator